MGFARTFARGLKVIEGDETLVGIDASDRLSSLLGGGPTIAGPPMDPERGLQMITVNAAVRMKVNAVRAIPFLVYKRAADGFKDYAAGAASRYEDLLHIAPNDEQPADEAWSQIAGHLAYRKNAYLWKEKYQGGTRDGLVKALWPIDPRRVSVKRKDGVRVYEVSRRLDGDAQPMRMTSDELLHIRAGMLSPDGLVGLSPIQQCRQELAAHAATREYLAHHLGKGANFAGYLYNDNSEVEIDDDERDRIESQLIAPARGARGSTRIPLFNAALKWQQIGMSLADQQFLELMGFGVADVARLMDIPPTLLNAPIQSGSLTYRTTREEDQRFLTYGISPDLTAIEGAINADLDLYRASPFVAEFRREAHIAMDIIARYQAHSLAILAGWKTPNDVRRIENLQPVTGGDSLLRPGQAPDEQTRALLELLENYTGAGNGNGAHPEAVRN